MNTRRELHDSCIRLNALQSRIETLMIRPLARLVLVAIATCTGTALAQDFGRQRELNALHDMARAQEHQARELSLLRQLESDRARREENDRVNAKRDARSMRRFDRP